MSEEIFYYSSTGKVEPREEEPEAPIEPVEEPIQEQTPIEPIEETTQEQAPIEPVEETKLIEPLNEPIIIDSKKCPMCNITVSCAQWSYKYKVCKHCEYYKKRENIIKEKICKTCIYKLKAEQEAIL